MKETQGALSMLLRRYRLILGKCRLRNALAGLLLGAVLLAPAVSPADSGGKVGRPGYPEGSHYTGTTDGASGPYTADKGHVIISNQAGDLDAKSFYGGHADGKGDVTDNKVEMRGERSRAANIYGGLTENGQASGNRVSVENGRIGGVWAGGRIYAGFSEAGNARDNTLEIRNGYIEGSHTEVSAGYAVKGDSTGNGLTISGGSISRTSADHFVSAGFSHEGNARDNTLTVTGGELGTEAYGGYVRTGTGEASDNRVEFSGSTSAVTRLTAGWSGGADARGNSLVMSSGTVRESLTGGDSLTGLASGNKIEIHGGEVGKHVYAGHTDRGGASANELLIDGGTIAGSAYGSFIADNSSRTAEGSKISFGGTATAEFLVGGYSARGDAVGNEVTVSGGTVRMNVMGGESRSAAARNNTVRVTGGTIGTGSDEGFVHGGYSNTGSADNNTVILEGAPDLGGTRLYGGATGNGHGDMRTGNTLEIRTSGLKAVNVGNFANYRFILPEKTTAGTTVLTLTDAKGTDISNSSVGVAVAGGKPLLRKGDSVTLLANEHGLKAEGMTQQRLSGQQGSSWSMTSI
ncbi:hypothetical protein [Desulfovibrio sp.]|uniref:hypothetical protein n=1 Tax=Desulfovibrio sp. TaxID=885 RepID=UPI003077F2FB